ncbi:prenyltransferase/squalene oxidase repeat-containing protein [Rhizomonospora bruguierae]|uniref:prenyltransferase/squalene oxidase repeat-containing protein n=1 Tax=Rhizomonospora bruguierae TaxID=1581705 RepID=UPI001BCBCF9E|nr:prenyltransferase/squalene oxidase repeat-containing protein [Micromonospora sp. NBRC 107566]
MSTTAPAPDRLAVLPVTGEPDLWCTYAAVRTLSWLDRAGRTPGLESTSEFIRGRRNPDGGYAWSRGMPSDAWATFYCTSTLADLHQPLPDLAGTARWLDSSWSGDAYAMTPGQQPEVWATHFATRTMVEVCAADVPDADRLLSWLGALQTRDGGLTWTPEHAVAGDADVRAAYYGLAAWRALHSRHPVPPPWNVAALLRWLRARQSPTGAFRFDADADTDCMWATYRAVAALGLLGARPAIDPTGWITARRLPGGGFTRWSGYPVADVWASFCAVGALRWIGELPPGTADAVERRIAELSCAGGGFTYREPALAADALTVAATVLASDGRDAAGLRRWLEHCRLPNEGGIMYMPGRGAEIRCTLWALAAGAFAGDPATGAAIGEWLTRLHNPDGGFGCWHGRGSDLVSTAAAVGVAELTGTRMVDAGRVAAYVGGEPPSDGLRPGLQTARILAWAGHREPRRVSALLDAHRVSGGGWAARGNRMPDLLSTYEAVLTADRFGIAVDAAPLAAFLARTACGDAVAWSPLAPAGTDPLARCLHRLLRRRVADPAFRPPVLVLS